MQIPGAWRLGLDAGRLLVLSPFSAKIRRPTAETAGKRNELVAALARVVFVAHAEPGGEIERVAALARGWGKPVLGFGDGKGLGEVVREIESNLRP
jgi:predicted Rossmann fold nucleotide-binding protein DprA/Smf involved in DNA uptake